MARSGAEHGAGEGVFMDVVIQTAPDAIVTIDETGTVLGFSPAAERMFGYSEAEVLGRNVSCLMPAPHSDRHDDYLARYLRTGERRVIGIGREVRARRRDGDVFPAELAIGELKQDGRHLFTGFIRDISDRVEAERRANRLQRMLDRVGRMRALGEMSTALSHEINQPLAAISAFARAAARVLERTPPDDATARAHLDRIATEAQRAGEILRRMRRLVDRGRGDFRTENVNEMIREAIALSRVCPEQEGLNIRLELAEALPPVLADRVQIQQVVINLLRNAVEAVRDCSEAELHVASERADPDGAISVRAGRTDGEEVMVTIGDEGPGLPEDLAERLFDPFVTTKEGGVGIGLAICRTIVHAHGGRIWAEQNAAGGADFHFTLPAAPAA